MAGYRGRGWAVVASARTIKPSEDPDLRTVAGDIAESATADRITGALERFGRIDILVSSAGVYVSKPLTGYTAADYAAVAGVNLTGFFWLTGRAIAETASRYGGHVVNISATLAEAANSGTPAALAALTKGRAAAGLQCRPVVPDRPGRSALALARFLGWGAGDRADDAGAHHQDVRRGRRMVQADL